MTRVSADPPLVRTLVQPLLALRASLGTGVATPDATVTKALSSASAQAAGTEGPHRDGVHALESTWAGAGADAAVPALRTTQTQIGDISDRGPAYLAVLTDAHSTTARAAQRVDQIIADFRRDAKSILSNATAAPDTDAVITRATQALRDAITAVTTAQTEMDQHTRTLDAMGPLTVTQPLSGQSPYTQSQTWSGTPEQPWSGAPGQSWEGSPGQYWSGTPGQSGPPMDPAQAAQLQLQQQLIAAGVQVGTAAINAGVDIGTHLIDKIAEVGTHTIDDLASMADKAIPQLLHPGSNNGTDGNSGSPGSPGKLFDFGAGQPSTTPGTIPPASNGGAPAATGAPAQNGSYPLQNSGGPAVAPPKPEVPDSAPPAAAAAPAPGVQAAPAPGKPAPDQNGATTGGVAMPPSAPGDQEHKPRDGQLGVTTPAAEEMVPVAVIGDFGDDTL
jgi:hypothetical protein